MESCQSKQQIFLKEIKSENCEIAWIFTLVAVYFCLYFVLQKLIEIDKSIVICEEEDVVFLSSPNPCAV